MADALIRKFDPAMTLGPGESFAFTDRFTSNDDGCSVEIGLVYMFDAEGKHVVTYHVGEDSVG